MARPQAADYHEKRTRYLSVATQLFAEHGFHATSITDIALACNTSKSRLYHYFKSKEHVLYEILRDHANTLTSTMAPVIEEKGITPAKRLENYAAHFLSTNVKSRAQHKLILNELEALPEQQRQEVSDLLRGPVTAIYDTLVEINPALADNEALKFPSAMMFLGMVNWSHTWFSGTGDLSVESFAKLICDTFLGGFGNVNLTQKP
ncbi:MAG: TetR family transcriptional regulator [Robiginitomaculum sp.]|nr:MAG: TetR family transcriptional regulator [Robiginitomaculum sp.]